MEKVEFDLDDLKFHSFTTTPEEEQQDGTVYAQCYQATFCMVTTVCLVTNVCLNTKNCGASDGCMFSDDEGTGGGCFWTDCDWTCNWISDAYCTDNTTQGGCYDFSYDSGIQCDDGGGVCDITGTGCGATGGGGGGGIGCDIGDYYSGGYG